MFCVHYTMFTTYSTSDNEGGQSMRDRDQHILDRDRADSNLSQLAGAGGTGAGAGAGNVGGAVTNTNGAAGVLAGAAGGYTRISGNAGKYIWFCKFLCCLFFSTIAAMHVCFFCC